MEFVDIMAIAGAILASIGGASLIIGVLSSWLGKVWASRIMQKEIADHNKELEKLKSEFLLDTESFKTRLKKSEYIFEMEYDAASKLVEIRRNLLPTVDRPEMDYYEANDVMAENFGRIETDLGLFLKRYGVVLDDEAISLIESAQMDAGNEKFYLEDGMITKASNEVAGRVYSNLREAERIMRKKVLSQADMRKSD